jgi:hypothetical protein
VVVSVAGQVTVVDNPGYDFLLLVRPAVIDRVQPLAGPLVGGTLVTIAGSGFTTSADVYFVGYGADGVPKSDAASECVWRQSGSALALWGRGRGG